MHPALKLALAAGAALAPLAAPAQTAATTGQITFYELPAYLGRSITVTSDTPDLAAQSFAARAQSARVTGSWQVCPTKAYAGTCRTLTGNQPYLSKSTAVSVRPTASVTAATATSGTTAAATTPTTAAALNLEALDANAGTEGQDVTFYATPMLSGSQIAVGSSAVTTASAFCKLAGATSATSAGQARVQASDLIDLSAKAKVRSYALRDVVCRK